MASSSFLCLCLLLVAFVGHAVAAAVAPGHAQAQLPRKYDDLLTPAGSVVVPAVTGCWKSVLETSQTCARDVLQTLVFGTVHLGTDCCTVLGRVGEKCVADVLSGLPLGPAYLPIVKRICGLVSIAV